MRKSRMWALALILCFSISSAAGFAQEYPKCELGGGFSYYSVGNGGEWLGWNTWGAKNLNRWFGLTYDISGFHISQLQSFYYFQNHMDRRRSNFLAGVRLTNWNLGRTTPFFHVLAGLSRTATANNITLIDGTPLGTSRQAENAFAIAFGGGIDLKIKDALALRLLHLDYMRVRSAGEWEEGVRVSVGLMVRLGTTHD